MVLADLEAPADYEIVAYTDALPRDEWLELRRTGIGGSDAAAALGLSPWKSPVALYLDKIESHPEEQKEVFRMGHAMEDTIAALFEGTTGFLTRKWPVMLRSTRWSFMLANVDRMVYGVAADGQTVNDAILEVKNVDQSKAHEWKDGPPLHYRLQCQHYMAVLGVKVCFIAALIGGNKFVWFRVDRDDAFIEGMIAGEEKFWTCVQLERMPDIDGSDATKKALAQHYSRTEQDAVEIPRSVIQPLLEQWSAAKVGVAVAQVNLDKIESTIKSLMGQHELATTDGDVVATWKSVTVKAHERKESTSRRFHVVERKEQ